MLTYDLIKKLCRQKGVTVTGTERELGFARGSLCKVNTSAPSMEKVRKLAEYFEVDIEYLMNNGEVSKQEQKLNARDERDIKKDLDSIMEKLNTKEAGPASFDGNDIPEDDRELFATQLEAMLVRLKKINKDLYNPNKNKK